MKFTAEHWRATRRNILVLEGGKPEWQSVVYLRTYVKRGEVKPDALLRINGHDGRWTVRQILAPCPPGPPRSQPSKPLDSFHEAVRHMILVGTLGKAIVWDREDCFDVYDEGDHLPPRFRQIITGTEFNSLHIQGEEVGDVLAKLTPQLFSLYDSAEPNNAAYLGEP